MAIKPNAHTHFQKLSNIGGIGKTMTKRSLKYIKKIESNISFVNKESKKINRIYFISGLISLTMLLIILVNI
jgi:hypothetical protein